MEPAASSDAARRRETLPRRRIIRRRSVLRGIRERGKRRSNRWFVLTVQSCPPEDQARVAFLTPKRLGAAHVRNRLRRRMREIHRRYIVAETESPRYLVWSARTDAVRAEFEELKAAMLELWLGQNSSRRGA